MLRDVLTFGAAEAAEILGATEVSVSRTLQRARLSVDRTARPGALDASPIPDSPEKRELVSRFARPDRSRSPLNGR